MNYMPGRDRKTEGNLYRVPTISAHFSKESEVDQCLPVCFALGGTNCDSKYGAKTFVFHARKVVMQI